MITGIRRGSATRHAPSWVLAVLVAVASLNGIGLGSVGTPLTLPRQAIYLPIIAVAFAIGRRYPVTWPIVPLAAVAVTTGGAAVLDGLGQGATMLTYSALTVGLPWLVGQALRHHSEIAALAQERVEQIEATREAYAVAAAASLRHQIAADLHDHVGHDLALIAVQAGVLETVTDAATREGAARLRELASDATDRLRSFVGELTEDGRTPRSVSDVARRATTAGLSLTLEGDSAHPLLVRAAQEALTNAARHATGQAVHLSADPSSLLVTNPIVGDGAAIAPPVAAPGRGLTLLGERVEAAGGELLAGRNGATWRLSVRLPSSR